MNSHIEHVEREILRLVIEGADLHSVLARTCLLLEQLLQEAKCSILLVDPTGTSLLPGAAPSLAAEYTEALRGLPIGPDVGCCGTALATGKTIITENIATDPKWVKFKDLAELHHLAACWSIPLFDVRRRPIGTFAIYHTRPHCPTPAELAITQELSGIVSVAIAWQVDRDELVRARISAASANEAKSFFLTQMSHELRTPLNAILGFSDAMRLGVLGPLGSERYRQYAEHIHRSGELLSTLVDGLLDLSRLESGQLLARSEQFRLETLLRECIANFTTPTSVPIAAIHCQETEADLEIVGDRTALARVFINLLSNAVRHTPAQGAIDITWTRGASGIRIRVRDNGEGIPKETLAHLGKPFVRQTNRQGTGHNGSGLGIYISRSIIELHGGHLEIESELGVGTTVTVELPVAQASIGRTGSP